MRCRTFLCEPDSTPKSRILALCLASVGLVSPLSAILYCRYDFAVYGLLAPEIGRCFFPTSTQELQLINSFGVYLAAFIMRYVVIVALVNSLGSIPLFPINYNLFPVVGHSEQSCSEKLVIAW